MLFQKISERRGQGVWGVPGRKAEARSLGFLIASQGCLRTRTFQSFPLIFPTPLHCHLLHSCIYVGQNHLGSRTAPFFCQSAGLTVL